MNPMRTGTKNLLQTGMGKMKVMTKHHVKPQFTHRSPRADARREALALTKMAQPAPTAKNAYLIE